MDNRRGVGRATPAKVGAHFAGCEEPRRYAHRFGGNRSAQSSRSHAAFCLCQIQTHALNRSRRCLQRQHSQTQWETKVMVNRKVMTTVRSVLLLVGLFASLDVMPSGVEDLYAHARVFGPGAVADVQNDITLFDQKLREVLGDSELSKHRIGCTPCTGDV